MAFAYSQDVDASFSTFNDVLGNQTNIAYHNARPKALDWLREAIAPGALYNSAYSSPPCFPGTREEITGLIYDWASNPSDRCLCWLSGHVGTGKSAIAQTISQRCANAGQLAAAFFCSRRDADRSDGKKIISTIAYQLTRSFPSLEDPIRDAVEADPLIFARTIAVQFQTLILNPLTRNCCTLQRQVVVIDALDECDEKSAKEIASLISSAAKSHDLPLLFLVTSRPASHIELPFMRNFSVIKSFTLRDFDVRDDIRLFLSGRFMEICEDHPAMRDVAKPWPSDVQMDRLMEMSHDLFIFASSLIRFVDDPSNSPNDRLKAILSAEESSLPAYDELDKLYHQILGQCPDKEFLRLILGTIIVLQKPLPLPVIGILLRARMSTGRLRAILHLLRSVVLIPEDERAPVTIFHKSFVDFLTDQSRSGRDYWIDAYVYAPSLTNSCLDLLNGSESPALPTGVHKGIALDYARTHYLGLLREGMADDHFFEFFQLVVCNTAILVMCTLVGDVWRSIAKIGNDLVYGCTMIVPMVLLPTLLYATLESACHIAHNKGYLAASMIVTAACAVEGGLRCTGPLRCVVVSWIPGCRTGIPPINFLLRPITSGVVLDLAIRTLVGLDSGVACGALDMRASIMRAVTSGAIFDLVVPVIMEILAVVVQQRELSTQSPTVTLWMAGGAVGRAVGTAIIGIVGAFWTITVILLVVAFSTLFLNFSDITWGPASFHHEVTGLFRAIIDVLSDDSIPDTDHYLLFFIDQHRCRWMKARYHFALQRRKIPFSITAPLRYAFVVVEFYVALLRPTHVSATTHQERLYCDWCREMDVQESNRLKTWILRTTKVL